MVSGWNLTQSTVKAPKSAWSTIKMPRRAGQSGCRHDYKVYGSDTLLYFHTASNKKMGGVHFWNHKLEYILSFKNVYSVHGNDINWIRSIETGGQKGHVMWIVTNQQGAWWCNALQLPNEKTLWTPSTHRLLKFYSLTIVTSLLGSEEIHTCVHLLYCLQHFTLLQRLYWCFHLPVSVARVHAYCFQHLCGGFLAPSQGEVAKLRTLAVRHPTAAWRHIGFSNFHRVPGAQM